MRAAVAWLLFFTAPAVFAHEIRPAYLDLHEDHDGEFRVLWKTPLRGELRLSLWPTFSGQTKELTPVATRRTDNAAVQTWRLKALEPLRGQSVRIAGLEATMTDALVRVEFADGAAWALRLTPGEPEAVIPARDSGFAVAGLYLKLGIEHILLGFDHLLFVLALVIITQGAWPLTKTITAFTVAHSITLATAALGFVRVAAVWANENTREALFDAMVRRETYATTGPRMIVRFFGGWDFEARNALNRLPAAVGYSKGVPMGGDLRGEPSGQAATFLVAALKDPIGANLDRIQIVKGWIDAKGDAQERVYDVVWGDADKRKPGSDGKLPPVGNTVDVENAIWANTIDDPELIAVWKDPDFDAKQQSFYYARVIEIPTPRWTAYDAKRFGVKPLPGTTMTLQERAYTSPIWYTPGT